MNPELLLSLARHWTWADRQRELFFYYLQHDFPTLEAGDIGTPEFFHSSMFTCMVLWYSLLYATCEGLVQEAGQPVKVLGPDWPVLEDRLRRFRNAVFHTQTRYWSPKLADVLTDEAASDKIRALHTRVGAWLNERLDDFERPAPSNY